MLALVHRLQPEIIVNNRAAFYGDNNPTLRGDFDTPELRLGEFQNDRPWESCMTVVTTPDGGGWSYRTDGKVKSAADCIRSLVSCACGDGNRPVARRQRPDSTGIIPVDQAERLKEVGAWLKINGASIYKTRGGPYRNGTWGGSTYRDRTIYIHVFHWPTYGLVLPSLKATILSFKAMNGVHPRERLPGFPGCSHCGRLQ